MSRQYRHREIDCHMIVELNAYFNPNPGYMNPGTEFELKDKMSGYGWHNTTTLSDSADPACRNLG